MCNKSLKFNRMIMMNYLCLQIHRVHFYELYTHSMTTGGSLSCVEIVMFVCYAGVVTNIRLYIIAGLCVSLTLQWVCHCVLNMYLQDIVFP